MKALTAIITGLSILLMILNMLGAVVSGIWLIVIGQWTPILGGIVWFIVSSFLLGFALAPGLLLAAPAVRFAERRQILGVVFFGTLSSIYTLALVTLWCCAILFLFVKDASASSLIPRLIWSYGVATGPWAYLASQGTDERGEDVASMLTTFFAQLAYVVVMLLVLFTSITLGGAIWVFAGFMLLSLIVQTTSSVFIQLDEKKKAKLLAEDDLYS